MQIEIEGICDVCGTPRRVCIFLPESLSCTDEIDSFCIKDNCPGRVLRIRKGCN